MKIKEILQLLNSEASTNSITIPEYQREYVWDGTDNVSMLLDSFIRHYPVGSIVLWQTKKKGKNTNVLIDGLQRTFSINAIRNMPLKFLTWEVIVSFAKLKNIKINEEEQSLFDSFSIKLRNSILNFNEMDNFEKKLSKITDEEKYEKLKSEKFLFNEEDKIDLYKNKLISDIPISDSWLSIIDQFVSWCKGDAENEFGSIDVNVIEIPETLNDNDIPEVFERINSNGKKLSNYEILSSTWSSSSIEFEQKIAFIDEYIEKRKMRYEKSLNVDNIEIVENLDEKIYNPSSIIYALFTKILSENEFMKNIFMSNDVISDINTMSYIIAFYLGIDSTKKFNEIGMKLKQRINGDSKNLIKIKNDLSRIFKDVSNSLSMFNFLNNDGVDNKVSFRKIKTSEHLIVSFINTLIKLENEKVDEIARLNTIKSFKYWFIIEGIDSNYGSGSGSKAWKYAKSKKYSITLSEYDDSTDDDENFEEIENEVNEHFNTLKTNLKNTIDNYIKLEKAKTSIKTYTKESVLILALIQFSKNEISSISDHVDHVIPKSTLSKAKILTRMINSTFNLQLLGSVENLAKGKKISVPNLQWDWLLTKNKISESDKLNYLENLSTLSKGIEQIAFENILQIREENYLRILDEIINQMDSNSN